ncbi:MAG: hypothetical protein ACI8UO_002288 [Verrucomicrobiales bacterium]|jgi:hypothetical protein
MVLAMNALIFLLVVTAIILVLIAFGRLSELSDRVERLESQLEDREFRKNTKPPVELVSEEIAEEPVQRPSPPATPPPLPAAATAAASQIQKPPPLPRRSAMTVEEPPRRPQPPKREKQPEPKPERSWKELLERIHLLPPSSEETTEVRLASWWATRVGIVLGVIASVFFGVHVSQDAPPFVRLAMLGGVAAVLLGLGLWIERKLKAFGQVLSAGGLAIFYVTAFAAYAFEPMKVVESSVLGLALQLLGVTAMASFSIWKRAESLGTIAILLGYVSCWFSHAHDLDSFTIGGLLMLAAAASALFFRLRWAAPFAVAMVGGYVGFALLVPFHWAVPGAGSAEFHVVFGAVIALMAIFHLTLHGVHLLRGPIVETWRVTGVIANSAFAIVVGLFAVAALHPESISIAYFVFGIVFFAAATLEFWKPQSNRLTSLLFLQSMAAFALFSIYEFVGPTEWLALGFQSLVLAVALIWSRSRVLEFAGFALWVAAFGLFLRDVFATWPADPWPHELRAERFLGLVFGVVQAIGLVLHLRWVRAQKPRNVEPRTELIRILSFCNGLGVAFVFMIPMSGSGQQLLVQIFAGLAMAGLGIWLRSSPPMISGCVILATAIGHHFCLPHLTDGIATLTLVDGLLLLVAGIAAAELLSRFWNPERSGREVFRLLAILGSLAALCSLLLHADFQTNSMLSYLVWTPLLFVILGFHARWRDSDAAGDEDGDERAFWRVGRSFTALAGGLIMLVPVTELLIGQQLLSVATFLAATVALSACLITRDAIPALAAAPLFLFGIGAQFLDWAAGNGAAPIWQVLVLTLIPMGIAVIHHWKRPLASQDASRVADGGLHLFWMLPVLLSLEERLPTTWFIAAVCGLGLAVFVAGLKLPFLSLRTVAVGPLVVGAITALAQLPYSTHLAGLWVGFGLSFLLMVVERATDRKDWFGWIAVPVTSVLGLIATLETFDPPWDIAALAAFGVALAAAWRLLSLPVAAWIAPVVFGIAIFRHLVMGLSAAPTLDGLIAATLLSAALLGAGLLFITAPASRFSTAELRRITAWLFPIAALFVFLPTIAWNGMPGSSYATAFWGVAGSVVFLGGLLARVQAHRIAGLIALGAGVVRMFFVDLDDTFGRIIAFGAVAIALLIIGYLYARFREFIEQESK